MNFIQDGQKVTFEEYKKLLKYQDDLFLRFNKEIKNIDIIITHSTADKNVNDIKDEKRLLFNFYHAWNTGNKYSYYQPK